MAHVQSEARRQVAADGHIAEAMAADPVSRPWLARLGRWPIGHEDVAEPAVATDVMAVAVLAVAGEILMTDGRAVVAGHECSSDRELPDTVR